MEGWTPFLIRSNALTHTRIGCASGANNIRIELSDRLKYGPGGSIIDMGGGGRVRFAKSDRRA